MKGKILLPRQLEAVLEVGSKEEKSIDSIRVLKLFDKYMGNQLLSGGLSCSTRFRITETHQNFDPKQPDSSELFKGKVKPPTLCVSGSRRCYRIVTTHPPACIIVWLSTVYHLRIYSNGYPTNWFLPILKPRLL